MTRIAYGSETYHEVLAWVHDEAACLDESRHRDWLGMLTDDVRYRIPVRVTTAHSLDDSLREDMAGDDLEVRSNVLLFRSRGDIHAPDLVSAGRVDRLRREPGGLRLADRVVTLDESVVRMQNFAVFL